MTSENERFWKLLEPIYERLLLFSRKLMNDKEKGDDLLQESLLLGMKKISMLNNEAAFKPWMYRIIMNNFKMTLRKDKVRNIIMFDNQAQTMLETEDLSSREMAKYQLDKLFDKLSASERSLIVLYELENWSIAELSQLLNKSEGSIKQRLFRSREKMKKELIRLSKQSAVWSEFLSKDIAKKYAL